jgi:hypothetical protein
LAGIYSCSAIQCLSATVKEGKEEGKKYIYILSCIILEAQLIPCLMTAVEVKWKESLKLKEAKILFKHDSMSDGR